MAAAPRTPATTVACSATGTKLFSPALTADEACRRFVAAFGKASGRAVTVFAPAGPAEPGSTAAGAVLTVELKFMPQGVASASLLRIGQAPVIHELAVSDRGFAPADIDRLAADAAKADTGRS